MSGKLFLIIGPSGVGKGSLITKLKERHSEYLFPISVTTRDRRSGEKDGEVYSFLNIEDFRKKIKDDEILEWAIVHQKNYYGTLKKPIIDGIKDNKIVIRELDIQGFESIIANMPTSEVVSIFVMPPSIELLEARIKKRGKMSSEELDRRIQSAKIEINKSAKCDYRVINEENQLDKLVQEVENIIKKESQSGVAKW